MNTHVKPELKFETVLTPIAIIIGSLIVAWSNQQGGVEAEKVSSLTATPAAQTASLKNIRPIQPTDHVLGNRNAKVVLVEYSDIECPYCKTYHQILHRLIKNYGANVAWVYRHNPLASHAKAQKEAEATECAAELGGETAFWKYIDKTFEITPSNNGLDPAELPKIAVSIGLNEKAFNDCLSSGRQAARVAVDKKEIEAAGQRGTPYSILMAKNENVGIKGAVSYESLEARVKEALKP